MSCKILSKYKACLVGAVFGDCLGALFEGSIVEVSDVHKHFSSLYHCATEVQQYTDDTAMSRQVAESLICKKEVDIADLAKRFTVEYFKEPWRGYGANVGAVFEALKAEGCKDPLGPSARQFNGMGSYGNGSAMRIAPAALFAERKDCCEFTKIVKDISLITHSHCDALKGTLLLAQAIKILLHKDPDEGFDKIHFIRQLQDLMTQQGEVWEPPPPSPPHKNQKCLCQKPLKTYCAKLDKIKHFLSRGEGVKVPRDEIVHYLGNNVTALGSVPTALYCFLRSFVPVVELETYNILSPGSTAETNEIERTILYAITLGGDTDTIATMAGAMAGAFYGIDKMHCQWDKICEGVEDAEKYAEELFKINYEPQYGCDRIRSDSTATYEW